MNLANIYIMQKNPKKAEEVYKKALEIKKNDVKIMKILADLYEKFNKKKEAIMIYEQMLKLLPNNKDILRKIKSLKS